MIKSCDGKTEQTVSALAKEWTHQYFRDVRTSLRLSVLMCAFGIACAVKAGGDLGAFFGLICAFWVVPTAGAYYGTRLLIQSAKDDQ